MSEVNRWLWCQRELDMVLGSNDIKYEIEDIMVDVLREVGYHLFKDGEDSLSYNNLTVDKVIGDMFYYTKRNPEYIYRKYYNSPLSFKELGYNDGEFNKFKMELINNCVKVLTLFKDDRVTKILECVEYMKNDEVYSKHSKKIICETMELIAYKLHEVKPIDKIIEDEAMFVLNMEWYDGLSDFYFEGHYSNITPPYVYNGCVEKLVKIIKKELNFLFDK